MKSEPALLTNPITAIVAGGIAATIGIKKLMGQREHMAVNKLRDAWFAQHGGLAGVNQAAEAATGNLALTQAIFAADRRDEFAAATAAWVRATAARPSDSFAGGTPHLGFMNFGSGRTVRLHGEEAVIPKSKAGQFGFGGKIVLVLDGREIAYAMVPHFPDAVHQLAGA